MSSELSHDLSYIWLSILGGIVLLSFIVTIANATVPRRPKSKRSNRVRNRQYDDYSDTFLYTDLYEPHHHDHCRDFDGGCCDGGSDSGGDCCGD